jgi:hypothetical protein
VAKQDFLANLRIARNLFAHPHVETDSPGLNAPRIADILARAAIWLTPKSVNGFDPNDFTELGPIRLAELEAAIREFSDVARQVPPTAPATDVQLRTASSAFARILTILEPYVPIPQEREAVERALESLSFPAWVVNWDCELGTDADGLPCIYFNVFVDEQGIPRQQIARGASELTEKIRRALSTVEVRRWPYVRVRTAAEHKAV